MWKHARGRRVPLVLAVTAATAVTGIAVAGIGPAAHAAAGCQVTYQANQWTGGFTANVRVTAGDAVNGWTVTWTYANGQSIQSAWNAAITGNGSSVTARNVSYNGKLGAGQSTTFGFTGSVTGSNSAPSVSCTAG